MQLLFKKYYFECFKKIFNCTTRRTAVYKGFQPVFKTFILNELTLVWEVVLFVSLEYGNPAFKTVRMV